LTWFLDLRALPVGGDRASRVMPTNGIAEQPLTDLLMQARGRHVTFVAHGFNVSRQEGVDELSGWAKRLTLQPSGLLVGVLWPGDSRYLPVLDYPGEDSVAAHAGKMLGPLIERNFTAAAALSFVSHSLGARVVLETIRAMSATVGIHTLSLMAGAIDDDCLTNQYRLEINRVNRVQVLASLKDDVLSLAFPVGNLAAGIISQGHPYWHAALGHRGPEFGWPGKIVNGWQIPDEWEYGHGDYLPHTDAPPAVKFPVPAYVPDQTEPAPPDKPAWSASIVSTRLR